jgi:hypothetical protein
MSAIEPPVMLLLVAALWHQFFAAAKYAQKAVIPAVAA